MAATKRKPQTQDDDDVAGDEIPTEEIIGALVDTGDIDEAPSRFKRYLAPESPRTAGAKPPEPPGFNLNGVDIECIPDQTHAALTAQWRCVSAGYKSQRQQAYADYLDAVIVPVDLVKFHQLLRNPLTPIHPQQIKDICNDLWAAYADRPTEPSS